jgi:hypothetical protein
MKIVKCNSNGRLEASQGQKKDLRPVRFIDDRLLDGRVYLRGHRIADLCSDVAHHPERTADQCKGFSDLPRKSHVESNRRDGARYVDGYESLSAFASQLGELLYLFTILMINTRFLCAFE